MTGYGAPAVRAPFVDTFRRLLDGEAPAPLPAPWLGWCLVALCRQRARQAWLMLVRAQRLAGVQRGAGEVPGLAGWTYAFHGVGLLLTGPDGEELDVNFHDAAGGAVDPWFFARRVHSLDPAPAAEARLLRFLPTDDLLVEALHGLVDAGLLRATDAQAFGLAPELEAEFDRVAAVRFDDPEELARWGRALGDGELGGGVRPGEGAHRAWLLALADAPERASGVVDAVAQLLPAGDAAQVLTRVLEGPVGAATASAVAHLDRLPVDAGAAVARFLERLRPGVDHPFSAAAACGYLLRRGLAVERAVQVLLAFAEVETVPGYVGNPFIAELAALALEHAPERALPLVRRALRGSILNAEEMAALLAAVDQPWCHRELERAARDPAVERGVQRRLAHALTLTRSEVARRRGRALAPPPEPRDADTVGYTLDEVDEELFAQEPFQLDAARPLAERLRALLPPDFGAGA